MTLPYAFVYPIHSDSDLYSGCAEDGLNPNDYFFCQYGWIPDQYRDSFSRQFIGEKLTFTIAHRRFDR